MSNSKKNNTVYVSLILPVIAIALAFIGVSTKGLVGDTFSMIIVGFLAIGAVSSLAGFLFRKVELFKIIAVIFYGLALGFIFKDGVEVLIYYMIGIDNNVGGQGVLTMGYLAVGAILLLVAIINTFFNNVPEKKKKNK